MRSGYWLSEPPTPRNEQWGTFNSTTSSTAPVTCVELLQRVTAPGHGVHPLVRVVVERPEEAARYPARRERTPSTRGPSTQWSNVGLGQVRRERLACAQTRQVGPHDLASSRKRMAREDTCPAPTRCYRLSRLLRSGERMSFLRQGETQLRVHHLCIRLIGIIWGLCLSPVVLATPPAATVPVCLRTPRVREALVRAICPRCTCAQISPNQLALLRELNMNQLGLTRLKPGDLSGLSRVVTLDLTDNPLKSLPDSLSSQLGALMHLKMDLSLFTRLPTAVVTPFIDRPGFSWFLAHPTRSCGSYTARPPPQAPVLPPPEVQAVIRPFTLAVEVETHVWVRGIYLIKAWDNEGNLQLFALTRDEQQQLAILAHMEQPIPMSEFSSSLDLAPYRLSATELGFGLRRLKRATVASRLHVEEEELQVFRLREGKIERVLKTVVYTHQEKLHPGPEDTQTTPYKDWNWEELTCSLIAVSESKTRGIFNWVKVSSRATSGKPSDNAESGTSSPSVLFRWTGERYEPQGTPATSFFFADD